MVDDVVLASGKRFGPYTIHTRVLDRIWWPTYQASHTETGQSVEIQAVDARDRGEHSPSAEDFLKVLATLRALESKRLPRALDGGIQDGIHWIAREAVESVPVYHFRTEAAPPTIIEAISDIIGVAEGLSAATEVGIVHGNLNADVCVITREGPMALDLGSLLLFGLSVDVIQRSPLYRAPEQLVAGGAIDSRSDVYSLGMVLYGNLTGSPPYFAEDGAPPERLLRLVMEDLPNPHSTLAVAWPTVEAMIAKPASVRWQMTYAHRVLCNTVKLLRWDPKLASYDAAFKQKRAQKRQLDVKYFYAHAGSEASSGYRSRAKQDAAAKVLVLKARDGRATEPASSASSTSAPVATPVAAGAVIEGGSAVEPTAPSILPAELPPAPAAPDTMGSRPAPDPGALPMPSGARLSSVPGTPAPAARRGEALHEPELSLSDKGASIELTSGEIAAAPEDSESPRQTLPSPALGGERSRAPSRPRRVFVVAFALAGVALIVGAPMIVGRLGAERRPADPSRAAAPASTGTAAPRNVVSGIESPPEAAPPRDIIMEAQPKTAPPHKAPITEARAKATPRTPSEPIPASPRPDPAPAIPAEQGSPLPKEDWEP
jgi:serine/threonine protein kinase